MASSAAKQAQAHKTTVDQRTITLVQSVSAVRTLLHGAMGTITYLRNLLPTDNFNQISIGSKTLQDSRTASITSTASDASHSNSSHMKFWTIDPDCTVEGKKMLDMLDGVMDAVEKQYLKQCIFGIYMNKNDPNNMVETYTFDFSYPEVDDTGLRVPTVTLGSGFENLSLKDRKNSSAPAGPLSVGAVKERLKTVMKNVMTATTLLDPLPERRWATFKLHYYDERVPDDYEPQHFHFVDSSQSEWFFATHGKNERPERFHFGTMRTGFHDVGMHVASVAKYLPNEEPDDEPYHGPVVSKKPNPVEQTATKARLAELQAADALQRSIVWGADGLTDEDADGEVDEDCLPSLQGSSVAAPRSAPADVSELNKQLDQLAVGSTHVEQTQVLQDSCRTQSALPPSDPEPITQSTEPALSQTIDTQMVLEDMAGPLNAGSSQDDVPMLDFETQRRDSIQSFPMDEDRPAPTPAGIDCDCGVKNEDCDSVQCDGPCSRWYHACCVGYHSSKDKRMPVQWTCFECRLKAHSNLRILQTDGDDAILLESYKNLATFRRAIKKAENPGVHNLASFKEISGIDPSLTTKLFERLENEGFLGREQHATSDLGIIETRVTRRAKPTKERTTTAQTRWRFIAAAKRSAAYKDYFNPAPDVEARLMKLSDEVKEFFLVTTQKCEPALPAPPTAPVASPRRFSPRCPQAGRQASPAPLPQASSSSLGKRKTTAEPTQTAETRSKKKKIKASRGEGLNLDN